MESSLRLTVGFFTVVSCVDVFVHVFSLAFISCAGPAVDDSNAIGEEEVRMANLFLRPVVTR